MSSPTAEVPLHGREVAQEETSNDLGAVTTVLDQKQLGSYVTEEREVLSWGGRRSEGGTDRG